MDNEEVLAARAKLAQRMGDSTRTGGKGSVRRKNKVVHKTQITDDNKLRSVSKKFGCQPLQGIEEVNMFKDDNTIVHFQRPEVLSSIQSNAFIVMGKAETKTIKDLLPDIITQLGPKQMQMLKDIVGKPENKINEANEEEEEEIPGLVDQNFEQVSQEQKAE